MARILQYIHRPNMTELGMGNTHDRYIVGPVDKLKQFFPLGVTIDVVDVYSNKKYSLYSKFENNEFRIKLMGDICDDYHMEPGDEVIFIRYESQEGIKTTLQIIECGRVFLNPGKRENGVIKDFEIVNIEKLPRFSKESKYSSEYSFLGEKHQIEIEFSETRRKRTDSPVLTDFYTVRYDGKLLESKNSPIYYLSIRNRGVILKNLQKCEFKVLLNEGNEENKNNAQDCLQQIFYGAPGTGKSHKIKNDVKVLRADEKNLVFRTTFHPDSDYSTFVGAYKPTMHPVADKYKAVAGKDEEITYSFVPQAFLQAYVAAWNHQEDDVFLVIEEINRGNCAQIFGDLFQLLDRDSEGCSEYPIIADRDLAKYLNGKDDEGKDILTNKDGIKDGKLRLPKNFYIWATMNTSDQSLFPIDSAFKRRWEWVYQPIDTKKEEWYVKVGENYYSWTTFLDKVNDELLTDETAEDKHLGFYFCKATEKKEGTESKPNVITKETFVGKVLFYLWNDVFKVYGIPSSIGSSKDWPYSKFYQTNGEVDEEKVVELMNKLQITAEGDNENKEEETED